MRTLGQGAARNPAAEPGQPGGPAVRDALEMLGKRGINVVYWDGIGIALGRHRHRMSPAPDARLDDAPRVRHDAGARPNVRQPPCRSPAHRGRLAGAGEFWRRPFPASAGSPRPKAGGGECRKGARPPGSRRPAPLHAVRAARQGRAARPPGRRRPVLRAAGSRDRAALLSRAGRGARRRLRRPAGIGAGGMRAGPPDGRRTAACARPAFYRPERRGGAMDLNTDHSAPAHGKSSRRVAGLDPSDCRVGARASVLVCHHGDEKEALGRPCKSPSRTRSAYAHARPRYAPRAGSPPAFSAQRGVA